ncbi:hypothetical protein Bca101_058004 [Brassica carinata]
MICYEIVRHVGRVPFCSFKEFETNCGLREFGSEDWKSPWMSLRMVDLLYCVKATLAAGKSELDDEDESDS